MQESGSVLTMSQPTERKLDHLAEIAEAMSEEQKAALLATSASTMTRTTVFRQPFPQSSSLSWCADPFTVSAALRKRPSEDLGGLTPSMATQVPATKRAKLISGFNASSDARGGAEAVRFREYQAEIWSEKFEELCEFRQVHGHCDVPHTYAPLAQWVKRQRYQYKLKQEGKRSTLSDERIQQLNQVGFVWNSHDAVWEERLHELCAFKSVHGHCIVPSNYEPNPQLAVWVKRQRRQYKFYQDDKPTGMTQERIDKLEKVGFAWECRKSKSDVDTDDEQNTCPSPTPLPSDDPPLDGGIASPRPQVSLSPSPARKVTRLNPIIAKALPIVMATDDEQDRLLEQARELSASTRGISPAASSSSSPNGTDAETSNYVGPSHPCTTTGEEIDLASLPCDFFTFGRQFKFSRPFTIKLSWCTPNI